MRKYVLIFCSLLMGVFMSCLPEHMKTQNSAQQKVEMEYKSEKDLSNIRVGYCSPTLDGPFYVALEAAVKEATESYGMEYMMTDGQGDITKQVRAVEDLLSKGIQVLILNPLDPKALVPVVERAESEGVQVFILDSMIDDVAPYIAAVVANNQLNGEILGLWLAEKNIADPKIAIISGNQGNPVGREKRLGFIRGLADGQLHRNAKTNFQVVGHGYGGWNNSGGLQAMEDLLVAHPYINVLLAENDAMALGAMNVIKQRKLEDKILVLGYDGQKEAYELIKEGNYAATAQNSPKILGSTLLTIVARHLNDERVNRLNFTPSVLIDQKNVDQFYDPKALF